MAANTKSRPASSNYTMQMPFRPFITAAAVLLQLVWRLSPGAHAHLWRPEEGQGAGGHRRIHSCAYFPSSFISAYAFSHFALKFTESKGYLICFSFYSFIQACFVFFFFLQTATLKFHLHVHLPGCHFNHNQFKLLVNV